MLAAAQAPSSKRAHIACRLLNSRSRAEPRELDFQRYRQRHVALQVFYAGWDYHGFASQGPSPVETVEVRYSRATSVMSQCRVLRCLAMQGVLFEALKRTCLVPREATWQSCQYSRCGRTDKGVSACGQAYPRCYTMHDCAGCSIHRDRLEAACLQCCTHERCMKFLTVITTT